MIQKLTPQQNALFYQVKEEWTKFIISGETRLQKEQAEKGIEWIYKYCGFAKPEIVLTKNPYESQLKANELAEEKEEIGEIIESHIANSLLPEFFKPILGKVDYFFFDIRKDEQDLGLTHIFDQLLIWDILESSIQEKGLSYYQPAPNIQVEDINMLLQYDFFERLGFKQGDNFYQYMNLLKSGVYETLQFDGLCIVCPYPNKIILNESGLLHSNDEAALAWEGYQLWFDNGDFFSE